MAFSTAPRVEFCAEMVSLSPSQVTLGGSGGISAGACGAAETGATLLSGRVFAATFEGCCPLAPRASNMIMPLINVAASFRAPAMLHLNRAIYAAETDGSTTGI